MRKKSAHKPPQSYSDFLSRDVMQKIEQNVDGRIIQVSQYFAKQQTNLMQSLFLRMSALEQILADNLNISKDDIANMVASKQDEAEGYSEKDVAETGDRVRFTLSSQEAGKDGFSDPSKFCIDELGTTEFTKEVSEALVGMRAKDAKEVELTIGSKLKIVVDRISTKPKTEATINTEVLEDANA